MPEGPEIRRAADRVHKAIGGRTANNVFFAFEHLEPFAQRLTGRRVERVTSRGKAMLTIFEGDYAVYSHNQLYGRWQTAKPGTRPATRRSLRFAVDTAHRSALLYSASEIDVIERARIDEHPFLARLGPDALDKGVTAEQIDDRLASARFRRRQLAALLLDQGFVAGLGNYLRSDILFAARLSPRARPGALDGATRRRLAAAILDITRRSYRTRGVTNAPGRVAELKASGQKRREYRHLAFARAGKPCYECAEVMVREELGGRRLYRCPACQPDP